MASVVIPEFALLEVQVERVLAHASEPGEPGFGDAPEALDAVDVVVTFGKLVVAMVDTKVLVVAHIHQAIVAFEPVGVDDAVIGHLAPNMACSVALAQSGTIWV